jgi:hypothetical protein
MDYINKKLLKTFNILNKDDFKYDNFLQYFYYNYNNYNKIIKSDKQKYIDYNNLKISKTFKTNKSDNDKFIILQNYFINNPYLEKKEMNIYEYFISILHENQDVILNDLYISIFNNTNKTTKKQILKSISQSVQQTLIKKEPDEDDYSLYLEMQESMKTEMKDLGIIFNNVINYELSRKEEIRNIYNDTDIKCKKILNEEQLKNKLYNIIHYKIVDINNNSNSSYNIICNANNKIKTNKVIYENKNYKSIIKVYNNIYLDNNENNCIYILSGSNFKSGGMSDQGIETNETLLYLSSSIMINNDQSLNYYPLDENTFLFYPKVLIFKNYNDKNYSLLDKDNVKIISLLNSSPPIGNNIEQMIRKKLTNTFKLCAFLDFSVIIFDDWGVKDFNIPVNLLLTIFKDVILECGNNFKKIIFGIKNKELYNIYIKHLSEFIDSEIIDSKTIII